MHAPPLYLCSLPLFSTIIVHVVDLAETIHDPGSLPLSSKDISEIEKFIKEHDHTIQLYTSLCIADLYAAQT